MPSDSSPVTPLEAFRATTKRRKIHPREMAALWVIGAHFIFLPWAFGGMRVWAQWISLGFAVVGLGIALLPRDHTTEHTGSNAFRLIMWPKLVKFPIFWLGLLLLGLIVCQAYNPAWEYATDSKVFWLKSRPHNSALPTGVSAPLEKWNQWRMLIIYSSVWLTVCSIWVAFTRRHTVQFFLMALALNGLLLSVFGLAQRMFGNGKIYWFVDSSNPSFFSSFIYKNHGGAYLNLALAIACGLCGWYYLRGLRRMEKSNPSGVFAFFATCIAVSVLTSYARGATVMMLVFTLVCIAAFAIHQLVIPSQSRKPIVAIVLILIFGFPQSHVSMGYPARCESIFFRFRTQAWQLLVRFGVTRRQESGMHPCSGCISLPCKPEAGGRSAADPERQDRHSCRREDFRSFRLAR